MTADQPVFARTDSSSGLIVDLKLANKKVQHGGIDIQEIFGLLRENLLGSSGNDFILKDAYYDNKKDSVSVTLYDNERKVDVFGDESDIWKTGIRVSWSGVDFSLMPFFERLVCTNGNVSKQYGFDANVTKGKYNFAKINSILEQEILHNSDSANFILSDATKKLKNNNVSVKEFLQYRNMFNEETNPEILKKFFDISYLNNAYRCDIEEMHPIWKSTADTGKNAYDFFNNLTWIASHATESKIDEDFRRTIQIKASDLMFKKQFDLELLAPKITSWK